MSKTRQKRRQYRRHEHIELAAVEFWGDAQANPLDQLKAAQEVLGEDVEWTDHRDTHGRGRIEVRGPAAKPAATYLLRSATPFRRTVEVGPGLLVARVDPPYPPDGWDGGVREFFHRCAEAFMVECQPTLVQRIGVRYRNVFRGLPADIVSNLFALRVVDEGPGTDWIQAQQAAAMSVHLNLVRGQASERVLAVRFDVSASSLGQVDAALDLDYFMSQARLPDARETKTFLDDGHADIYDAFESLITEALRERLEDES